jgi:hypothetical protein
MIEGSGSGFIPMTSGSGSKRPKNLWIRNTATYCMYTCQRFWANTMQESLYSYTNQAAGCRSSQNNQGISQKLQLRSSSYYQHAGCHTELVYLTVYCLQLVGGVILISPNWLCIFGHPIGLNQNYTDVNYNFLCACFTYYCCSIIFIHIFIVQ